MAFALVLKVIRLYICSAWNSNINLKLESVVLNTRYFQHTIHSLFLFFSPMFSLLVLFFFAPFSFVFSLKCWRIIRIASSFIFLFRRDDFKFKFRLNFSCSEILLWNELYWISSFSTAMILNHNVNWNFLNTLNHWGILIIILIRLIYNKVSFFLYHFLQPLSCLPSRRFFRFFFIPRLLNYMDKATHAVFLFFCKLFSSLSLSHTLN